MKTTFLCVTLASATFHFAAPALAADACDRQILATSIRADSRITLRPSHSTGRPPDSAYASLNIQDTANGDTAKRSNYLDPFDGTDPGPDGSTWLDAKMLDGMLKLAVTYNYIYMVTEIAGGAHTLNSAHYSGRAFDVGSIYGEAVSASNPYWQNFTNACIALGASQVLGPGYPGHDTHVHVEWRDLPAPNLIYPPNGAPNVPTTPTFTWSAVTSGDSADYLSKAGALPTGASAGYKIAVATSPAALPTDPRDPCSACVDIPSGTTSYAQASALSEGITYYWKVRGKGLGSVYGNWSCTYSFTTTGGSTPMRIIALSGDMAFGNVPVGSTAQRTLTISNSGNSTLNVIGLSYPSCLSGNWSGAIAANSSHDVTITFSPLEQTSYGGNITVNSDKTVGTSTIAFSGAGTIAATRIISLSGNLAFGDVTVGTSAQRTLTIANSGNSTLTVSSISYLSDFSGNWSGTIAAGSSQPVTVTFSPTSAISYSGNLTVSSDNTSGVNALAVSGTGTPVTVPDWGWSFAPSETLSPTDHVYGRATIFNRATSTAPLDLSNAGFGISGRLLNGIGDYCNYLDGFGRDEAFPWTQFKSQIHAVVLVPGQSHSFDLITETPQFPIGVSPGSYSLPVSIHLFNAAAIVVSSITNQLTWNVDVSSTMPTITTQPANQAVIAGENLTFAVAASSTPMPTLQWQVSTNSGSSWSDLANNNLYSGVTTGTLSITGATIGMSGYSYRCLASNTGQSNVASNPARLTVTPPAGGTPAGFALIPAGTFTMGDNLDGNTSEQPTHAVTLPAFYLARTEVTWADWVSVRDWAVTHGYSDLASVGAGKADTHPVQTVSWYDVVKWCNAKSEKDGLVSVYYTDDGQTTVYRNGSVDVASIQVKWTATGYRLPTEAEWEYAARGGLAGKRFPWGDTITHQQANYYSDPSYAYDTSATRSFHPTYRVTDGFPYTSPVGSFAGNGYGLHDMAGNVWEWCWDWYGSYGSAAVRSPLGPLSGTARVRRSGGWADDAFRARSALHSSNDPSNRYNYMGFRPARSSSSETTPTITTQLANQAVTLLWPDSATGYRVESALSLSPPTAWSNVTGTFQTNGGFISIVLPTSGAQKFYRLVKP